MKLHLCLVLIGMLTGCTYGAPIVADLAGIFVGGALAGATGQPDPEPWNTGKNHYEPIIIASNKEMIRIKYLSVGPNAEHEQAKQLMIEHCDGSYVETSRVELRGYDTVEAECIHDKVLLRADTSNQS